MTKILRKKGHAAQETPSFSVGKTACAQNVASFSSLMNNLENTKGSVLVRVEEHLGFMLDTAAVKAELHHNCFLTLFQMVFRSLTPCQVC